MSEHEKGGHAAVSKIIQLIERDQEASCSKIDVLQLENQAASSMIEELEKEKEAALNKITQLEREGAAALSKIIQVEKEKEAAFSKIAVIEKEKDDATSKIALLEKQLRSMEEKFGKYKSAQLRKEIDLRTKFQDFKRDTSKEKEAAMSKIAMLEKELETEEVRVYKQAIRALKQIQVDDTEPKEKVKELQITVQKLTNERKHWETLAKQLKDKESETAELDEARKEMIRVFSDLCNGDTDIGIKKFGVIDIYPFHLVCKQKFSRQIAEERATNLCSTWQTAVEDPKWDPFRTYGEARAYTLDQEDKNLQQLRNEWGYEAYLAVAVALTEIKESKIKGRTMTHQLWNFKDGRKATLKEAICLMREKMKGGLKIKDTAFGKVDQLKPGTSGHNLVVKILNTNLVVDKTQDTLRSAYSNPRVLRVAECLVGDETGTIVFTARNEQVDLMEPGSILLLCGAEIQMFRGNMRLAVERRAQIIVAEPIEFAVNEDNNVSLVEYVPANIECDEE